MGSATKHDGPLEADHKNADDDRYDMIDCVVARQIHLDFGPHQAIYVIVASHLRIQSVWAALMCFFCNAKYDGPLEAAYAHIDGVAYDMIDCTVARQIRIRIDLISPPT